MARIESHGCVERVMAPLIERDRARNHRGVESGCREYICIRLSFSFNCLRKTKNEKSNAPRTRKEKFFYKQLELKKAETR